MITKLTKAFFCMACLLSRELPTLIRGWRTAATGPRDVCLRPPRGYCAVITAVLRTYYLGLWPGIGPDRRLLRRATRPTWLDLPANLIRPSGSNSATMSPAPGEAGRAGEQGLQPDECTLGQGSGGVICCFAAWSCHALTLQLRAGRLDALPARGSVAQSET